MDDTERTVKLDLRDIPEPGSKRPVLVVLQGQALGLTIHLDKERVTIGRGTQADLTLGDEIASRLHAEIVRLDADDASEYYLCDLESTNGTFLNGAKIASQQLLQDGDKIKVGNHLMKFAMLDEYEAEFQDRLHQMTQRDELTGLRSRRSLFAELDSQIARAANSANAQPISVIMMDLDFFKRVNDTHGHLIGSHTIRDVGHIIGEVVGSSDLAARYGGEEFFAYIFGPRQRGIEIAEQIRKSVEAHVFAASTHDLDQTMNITISLGVACFPEDGRNALDVIQLSDQALYRAKLSGRNQTCVYDPNVDRPDSFHQMIDSSAIIYGPADAQ